MKFNIKPKFNVISLLPLLVLCLCLGTTYHLWNLAYQLAKKEQQQQFDVRANEIEILIKQRLQAYAEVLHGGRGLFYSSKKVSRLEFKNYIAELQIEQFYPGIQGVGFSLLIPAAEKQQHIAAVCSEGFPDYRIWPEGERDFYSSVVYLEPFSNRNLRAFGYDMYSEPVRRTAMDKAWQENTIALSGKVKLVQEIALDIQSGFLMYLPLYRQEADISSVTARRANLLGWIYAPFRMNDFMTAVLQEKHELKRDVDVDIYDGTQISPQTLLYNREHNQLSDTPSVFAIVKPLKVFGHSWSLQIHSHPDFEAQIDLTRVYLTAISGIVITLMLTQISWLLVNCRRKALIFAEKKNAELLERETRYQQMFEGSSSIAVLIDPENGNIIDANPAASAFWGYSIEQLRGMNISQVNTLPLATSIHLLQQALQQSQHIYTSNRLSNGELREVEVYANAIVYQGRMVVHAIVHDITQRKQLEHSLKESEALLRSIVEASQAIIYMKDREGRYLHINQRFKEVYHFSAEDVLGKTDYDLFPHPIAEAFRQHDLTVLESGQALKIEEQAPNGNADYHTYITVKVPLRNATGEIYATCGVSTDITERKELELEREQFFTFFNLAPDFQCIAGRDGFFKKVNPTFMEVLGFSEAEVLQKPFLEFVFPDDRQATLNIIKNQLLPDGKLSLDFENRYVCKDGSLRWLLWKAIVNPNDGLIYAVARDITTRKQHEEEIRRLSDSELNKAKLEAEKANHAKSEFLSSMSHELRTPMNAVLGFAQLLEAEELTEDQQDSVKEILAAGYHLLELINDVLDLSKIEAEKVEFTFKILSLNGLINCCVTLLQGVAAKHQVVLVDQITTSTAFSIYADELRLKQVLLNLISNAIKYNQLGGSITLEAELINQDTVRIKVIDTGQGLSELQLAKLFQPFERLNAKNSTIEGTGIGLCISKKLIEAMHGSIGVDSKLGAGCCFWIEVPLA